MLVTVKHINSETKYTYYDLYIGMHVHVYTLLIVHTLSSYIRSIYLFVYKSIIKLLFSFFRHNLY